LLYCPEISPFKKDVPVHLDQFYMHQPSIYHRKMSTNRADGLSNRRLSEEERKNSASSLAMLNITIAETA
jgi:hypothetical protein